MREMCTLSVSNVIYHKFSHGAAFYTLNGKNVNVMLESENNKRDEKERVKMMLPSKCTLGKMFLHIQPLIWRKEVHETS